MKEWLYDWGGLNVTLFHAINANHAAINTARNRFDTRNRPHFEEREQPCPVVRRAVRQHKRQRVGFARCIVFSSASNNNWCFDSCLSEKQASNSRTRCAVLGGAAPS